MYGFNVLGLNPHYKGNHAPEYYTKEEVDAMLAGATPGEGASLKNYLTTSVAEKTYQKKGDYALKSDIPTDYAKKSDIPDYSEVYLPKGEYLTSQDISDLAKKSELFSKSYNDLTDTPDLETMVSTAISKLTEGADEAFDTLAEISSWLKNNDNKNASDIIEAINDLAKEIEKLLNAGYVTQEDLSGFISTDDSDEVTLEATTESGEIITYTLVGKKTTNSNV